MRLHLPELETTEARAAFHTYEWLMEATEPTMWDKVFLFILNGFQWRRIYEQESRDWVASCMPDWWEEETNV